jgi:hypothetical protein
MPFFALGKPHELLLPSVPAPRDSTSDDMIKMTIERATLNREAGRCQQFEERFIPERLSKAAPCSFDGVSHCSIGNVSPKGNLGINPPAGKCRSSWPICLWLQRVFGPLSRTLIKAGVIGRGNCQKAEIEPKLSRPAARTIRWGMCARHFRFGGNDSDCHLVQGFFDHENPNLRVCHSFLCPVSLLEVLE